MNDNQKAFVARWVKALRDGSYEQGQGYLKIPRMTEATWEDYSQWDGNYDYCCLGVACDLVDHSAWEDTRGEDDFVYWVSPDDSYDKVDVFPPHVLFEEWTGLNSDAMDDLAKMNDSGRDFDAIADRIEGMADGTIPGFNFFHVTS